MDNLEALVVIAPLIIGVIEALKRAGLPDRFAPLVALALGAGLGLAMLGVTVEAGISGVVAGLMAVGLYSGTRATMRG